MNHVQKMFSIRDSKSEIFHPPRFNNTHGEAERDFKRAANDPQTNICAFPEDFDLYFIGEYDLSTGKMTPVDTPQHVIKAIALKDKQ